MKTFNIWKLNQKIVSPTGPWEFALKVNAISENEAIETAKMRLGLDGTYKAYEGFTDL